MASILQMERDFFLEETTYRGVTGGGSAFDWWNEIDDSEKLQQGLFYALSAAYAIVAFVALVQLFRIQLRVPEYGWTTQKVFHLMNFVVNGLRAILFGLYKSVFLLKPKVLEMVLLDLPGLLFFSTYTLLVLFWAEIYHQVRSLPINKLRPAYFIINGVVYFIQVCMWIYMRLSWNPIAVEVARLFFSVISFFAALGFLIYGGRLFFMLRRFPIESRGRQKKLNEVGFITGICCTCFLLRCFVVALSAFDKNADLDVLNHPILNFVYYMMVMIIIAIWAGQCLTEISMMGAVKGSSLFLFICAIFMARKGSPGPHPSKGGRDCSICSGTLHPSKVASEACLGPVSSHPVKQAFAKS